MGRRRNRRTKKRGKGRRRKGSGRRRKRTRRGEKGRRERRRRMRTQLREKKAWSFAGSLLRYHIGYAGRPWCVCLYSCWSEMIRRRQSKRCFRLVLICGETSLVCVQLYVSAPSWSTGLKHAHLSLSLLLLSTPLSVCFCYLLPLSLSLSLPLPLSLPVSASPRNPLPSRPIPIHVSGRNYSISSAPGSERARIRRGPCRGRYSRRARGCNPRRERQG